MAIGVYALAGGADICLVPEIPYKIDSVIQKLQEIKASGRNHAIIVVSEGLKTEDGSHLAGAKNMVGEVVLVLHFNLQFLYS